MSFLVVLLIAVASVPLAGGRLSRLGAVELRAGWSLVAALVCQVTIVSIVPSDFTFLHPPLHLVSYGLAGWFVIANRGVPGVWIVGVGGALNALVIAANGGVMPASPGALAAAGIVEEAGRFVNSGSVADAHLAFLGDVFAIPASWPVANVFSIGDVLIVVGAIVALHRICESRLAGARRRDRRALVGRT